jgi:ligand-binding SRPBCC domain-containing protein
MLQPRRIIAILSASIICVSLATTAVRPQMMSAGDAIKHIDTECNAIQDAVMALKPVHVTLRSGTWYVLSDAQMTAALQTKASLTFADVWKQGGSYAWVHTHRFNASGVQRATQLCFRQSNGTLARVRQATTDRALFSASAQQAYYSRDGKLIQKTAVFAENDPMIAKSVEALPFYSVLPK